MARFNEKLPLIKVYTDSLKYYKSNKVDDKKKRSKIDVVRGKIIIKNNFQYNPSTKSWEQTGRSSKLVLEVKSVPKSYSKDTSTHIYPITYEFKDISLGASTPFRWRVGSQKRPIFKMPGKTAEDVAKLNIRNGVQLQFFFDTEYVAKMNGVLWGVCRANRAPRVRNPKNLLFLSKHDVFVLEKIILPFLNSGKGLGVASRSVRNV